MIRLRSSVSFLASFSLVSSLTISSLVESNDVWFKMIRGVSIGEKQNIFNQGNTRSTSNSLIRGVLIQSYSAGAKKFHQLCILSVVLSKILKIVVPF